MDNLILLLIGLFLFAVMAALGEYFFGDEE